MRILNNLLLVSVCALPIAACGDSSKIPEQATEGSSPTLPEPNSTLLPTVKIAQATGWPAGRMPVAAQGLAVTAFAKDLVHPRWLLVLPNGDVLVAETNGPEDRPEDATGVKGFVYKLAQKRAGAGTPSPDRITLLRDKDGDGIAETRSVLIEKLHSPFGMALIGDTLYVANTDAVVAFPYSEGTTRIDQPGKKIADLPGGPINHHWTKGLVANKDGTRLYASVGSNSNAAENGLDKETDRAAIHEIDLETGKSRVYASGLRNPVGMDFEPQTNVLWAVVNERDELGSDLVPDYLTSVKDGGFYGWPFSYWGQHLDSRVPENQQMVAKAIVPDYALGNHVAPLGLAFAKNNNLLPENLRNGAFIGEHGSWNRKPLAGYKVVFVPFKEGKPDGYPRDVLTGFVNDKDEAQGRPVGVAFDKAGALLVADDVGNTVWRVAPAAAKSASR
jgi:glucose/arabinose dehydrogenase